MTHDEFKLALLSSLESEHIGTLREIDKRLREAQVLIEGYRIDLVVGFVTVKLDFLRSLRPQDCPIGQALKGQRGSITVLERILEGLKGYVVVTDAELRVETMGTDDLEIHTTLRIEHTYVLKDGKYLCEWGDPQNPIHQGAPLKKSKPERVDYIDEAGRPVIRYDL